MTFPFSAKFSLFDEKNDLAYHSLSSSQTGGFVAETNDPQVMATLSVPLRPGWYVISGRIDGENISSPKVYFDIGRGINESDSVFLSEVDGPENYRAYFLVEGECRRLRFDPTEQPGSIERMELGMRKVSRHRIFMSLVPRIARVARANPVGFAKRLPAYARRFLSRDLRRISGNLGEAITGNYGNWLKRFDFDPERHMTEVRSAIAAFASRPLISIVTPTYNTEPQLLDSMIASVRSQVYENWELCIADDASSLPSVRAVLHRHASADRRIKVVYRAKNGHISAASNSAMTLVSGDMTTLADHDDELHPLALYHLAKAANEHPDWKILFSDEDKMDRSGNRFDPYFKGGFNRDLFYCHNLMTHLIAYRTEDIRSVGGFREGFEGSQDYDLALRILETVEDEQKQVIHIPHVLYHWRVIEGSIALGGEQKNYAHERARNAINEHFARTGSSARSVERPGGFLHRVIYPSDRNVLFSIVICTRDRVNLLRTCIESIFDRTTDENFEIVVVDNGSVDRETLEYLDSLSATRRNVTVVRDDGEFNFSRLNNFGVASSRGGYICLLNNDTEVIAPDWIDQLRMHLGRPEVGAVGAKLLYSDNTIQHAGVVMGLGGLAAHVYAREPADTRNNIGKAQLTQQVMAVTGACLATRRETWEALGGLDAEVFKVAYNDVDYCLKVWQSGMIVVYEPGVLLYHHESLSRGSDEAPDKIERFRREQESMREKWGRWVYEDRFFNPNFDYGRADFSLSRSPRVGILS